MIFIYETTSLIILKNVYFSVQMSETPPSPTHTHTHTPQVSCCGIFFKLNYTSAWVFSCKFDKKVAEHLFQKTSLGTVSES